MKITTCIGSGCHVKGSKHVLDALGELIKINGLEDKVELAGTFCMRNCQSGVSVSIEDEIFSVTPDTVADFFKDEVLKRII